MKIKIDHSKTNLGDALNITDERSKELTEIIFDISHEKDLNPSILLDKIFNNDDLTNEEKAAVSYAEISHISMHETLSEIFPLLLEEMEPTKAIEVCKKVLEATHTVEVTEEGQEIAGRYSQSVKQAKSIVEKIENTSAIFRNKKEEKES